MTQVQYFANCAVQTTSYPLAHICNVVLIETSFINHQYAIQYFDVYKPFLKFITSSIVMSILLNNGFLYYIILHLITISDQTVVVQCCPVLGTVYQDMSGKGFSVLLMSSQIAN